MNILKSTQVINVYNSENENAEFEFFIDSYLPRLDK